MAFYDWLRLQIMHCAKMIPGIQIKKMFPLFIELKHNFQCLNEKNEMITIFVFHPINDLPEHFIFNFEKCERRRCRLHKQYVSVMVKIQ